MKLFYSKTTGNCYMDGVEYRNVPNDLVVIDQDRFDTVIANPDPTKVRGHDENGLPILIDPPPPSIDELISAANNQRDELMAIAATKIAPLQDAVDVEDATQMEVAQLTAWKKYRVSLNRLSEQAGYPASIAWPVVPS